jgi:hypothetical protein
MAFIDAALEARLPNEQLMAELVRGKTCQVTELSVVHLKTRKI